MGASSPVASYSSTRSYRSWRSLGRIVDSPASSTSAENHIFAILPQEGIGAGSTGTTRRRSRYRSRNIVWVEDGTQVGPATVEDDVSAVRTLHGDSACTNCSTGGDGARRHAASTRTALETIPDRSCGGATSLDNHILAITAVDNLSSCSYDCTDGSSCGGDDTIARDCAINDGHISVSGRSRGSGYSCASVVEVATLACACSGLDRVGCSSINIEPTAIINSKLIHSRFLESEQASRAPLVEHRCSYKS
jgi:hypothetical protein